jgi:hypothetical protein
MQDRITCHHCGAPIVSRSTLAVGGRTLRPFHPTCFEPYSAQQPWHRKPGWLVNRWRSLIQFNMLLLAVVLVIHVVADPLPQAQRFNVAALIVLVNAWLLLARLVSYLSTERHLPVVAPRRQVQV